MTSSHEIFNQTLTQHEAQVLHLSHRIHAQPELGFFEHHAANWTATLLEDHGFTINRGVAGLETAFIASYGTGSFVVGICAEYDALPDIGHACGHNMIAAGAVGTALALAPLADALDMTVKVFGTPAEENGGGKVLMLDAGAFRGVHLAVMMHPAAHDAVECHMLANGDLIIDFYGRAAHASMAPAEGVNAADAATLTQVAVGLLRQHLAAGDEIHGIVVDGGATPNIVPQHTRMHYYVRSRSLTGLEALTQRLQDCAKAGALATGCEVQLSHESPVYANFVNHPLLTRLCAANASLLGRAPSARGSALGSTDMGNISQVIPALHPLIGIDSAPFVNHQPEFAEHCVTETADQALLDGCRMLGWTVIDVASDQHARDTVIASGLTEQTGSAEARQTR